MPYFSRRNFLKTLSTGAVLAGLPLLTSSCKTETKTKNKLPRWRGFNILDFFSPRPFNRSRFAATEQDFKWMVDWGLWNFRGSFGLMDSGRKDIVYEDWHGHQLDRKLLELLQKY